MTKYQDDSIWKLNDKLFAWIIFYTLLFISTLILHLQPTYWIPLFEGNKLVIRVLFLTSRTIFEIREDMLLNIKTDFDLIRLQRHKQSNFMQKTHLEKMSSYTAKILSS